LGSGGFGIVVGALLRGHPVVAKLPRHPEQLGSVKFTATLANELRIHRQLRHPNIVAFAGAVVDPHSAQIALLFEVVDGIRLDVFVCNLFKTCRDESNRFSQLKLLLDIGSALSYLHRLTPPIVHGDLEPANVLVDVRQNMPNAKLLHFGLSRLLTRNSKLAGGTKGWMAPEMLQGAENRSSSADVFAFGLLMRFIMTSERPAAPSPAVHSPAKSFKGQGNVTPEEYRKLWTACTLQDPTARPGMDNVYDALLNFVPDERDVMITFGRRVVMGIASGVSWHEGIKELEAHHRSRLGLLQLEPMERCKGSANDESASGRIGL